MKDYVEFFIRLNIRLIACLTKNLFTAITKKKHDRIPTLFVSGVYEMQLNTLLLMFYIDMAKQRLFERIKEQKKVEIQQTALIII